MTRSAAARPVAFFASMTNGCRAVTYLWSAILERGVLVGGGGGGGVASVGS